ncbi:MAG: NAD(P)H-hydrate dehydratase [Clostridia bacterium]|nr:NAD(P)H-hydrate dehydratase [Clostridia bacterium]
MKDVVSVKTMRESDKYTIENFVSSKELMRRAGEGIFKSHDNWGKCAIICGSGNNAGDGYVLASDLKQNNYDCKLFLIENKFSEDGKYYFEECEKLGIDWEEMSETTSLSDFDTVVDCIFGTGFHGEAQGSAKHAIDLINSCGAFVISADINSGLNGDTGMGKTVVRSDLTVSIGTLKQGHVMNMAKDVMKRVVNCDIGIPIRGEKYHWADTEDFKDMIPTRKNFSHKGVYGCSACLGGCTEYSGASKLANLSMASLKAGSGVSRLIVPQSIAGSVSPYLLENTLFTLPDENGHMLYDEKKLDAALSGIKSIACGMGWGEGKDYAKILEHILQKDINVVIDADGLNTLSRSDVSILKDSKSRVCLTPHLKEFSRLSGFSMDQITSDTINCAKSFAAEYGVVLLLKGTATIVTDGSEVLFARRGCPGMATAGSGDVLSGILAGLFGYIPLNVRGAALGAYIAGCAGEEAEKEVGSVGMTASDTVGKIAQVIKHLCATE